MTENRNPKNRAIALPTKRSADDRIKLSGSASDRKAAIPGPVKGDGRNYSSLRMSGIATFWASTMYPVPIDRTPGAARSESSCR